MHKIQRNNTNKIQHKRCKNWTKCKYIDPRSSRYACNRNTESTMRVESILYVTGDISNLSGTAAYRVSASGTSWQYHLAVYHKTTRLCIALSAHGSTRAKCIRSNGRIHIRSNTKDARTCRGEHPTAQRPNTLHNKIQPTFKVSYNDDG